MSGVISGYFLMGKCLYHAMTTTIGLLVVVSAEMPKT